MIRYRYVEYLQPPAPFVNISLHCQGTGNRPESQPALVDPAADRTVLPGHAVRMLGLIEDGRQRFQGFASEIVELPIFLVEVQLHDLPALLVRAALGEHEPYILLGRDVLNFYRILLDGPQRVLVIESL